MVGTWGFSFIAIEVALRAMSPGQLVLLRFLPTLVVFLPLALAGLKVESTRLTPADWARFMVVGLFGVAFYNIALNTGQTMIPASLAALVIALNPAAIALVAAFWLGERPPLRTWAGLLIALAGIAVVVLARHQPVESRRLTALGVLITLGAPVSWGVFSAGLRRYTPSMGALTPIALAMSLGTLPLLIFVRRDLVDTVTAAPPVVVGAVLFLTLACTLFGFTGWATVLKRMEAAKAGAFIYLVPLIAAVAGRFLLNEPLDAPLILGGIIVLAGVALATGRLRLPGSHPGGPGPPGPAGSRPAS